SQPKKQSSLNSRRHSISTPVKIIHRKRQRKQKMMMQKKLRWKNRILVFSKFISPTARNFLENRFSILNQSSSSFDNFDL
ncbi:hypothetical protein M5D96_005377, partial [Drosophila gunungcola]